MTTQTTIPTPDTIPDGFTLNAKGHLVPVSTIKEIDKLRDEAVKIIVDRAKTLQATMAMTKEIMADEFDNFLELSAREYDVRLGGHKGNVSLTSFDGKYKITKAVADHLVFDERLQVAKSLIDECLIEWTKDSNANIKAIIDNAFAVDKEGKINTYRVLSLRKLNISDEKWLKAMQAISDATQVVSSKEYIRLYERDENGKYQQISLDFASL